MSSSRLRHHTREEQQGPLTPTPSSALAGAERSRSAMLDATLQPGGPQAAAARPLTPTAAAELGSAAPLLQIASRLPQASSEESLALLRQRMRAVLEREAAPKMEWRGRTFQDQISTSDSRWIPALKWGAAALAAAAVSALAYYLWKISASSAWHDAIPAAGLAFSSPLRCVWPVDTRRQGKIQSPASGNAGLAIGSCERSSIGKRR